MKITWEVEDGYCGKSRPQHTIIDDDELAYCETEEDREKLIEDTIHGDFIQNITWSETGRD